MEGDCKVSEEKEKEDWKEGGGGCEEREGGRLNLKEGGGTGEANIEVGAETEVKLEGGGMFGMGEVKEKEKDVGGEESGRRDGAPREVGDEKSKFEAATEL